MAIVKATQVRVGMVLVHNSEPHRVTFFKHTVTGRGSACIPVKMKSLVSGSLVELTLRSDDKLEKAFIDEKEMEFLYRDGDELWMMDKDTFEQISLSAEEVGDVAGYLVPNSTCRVQFYDGQAIGVSVPNSVQLKVVDTEPAIKGATASGNVTKPATLETGLTIQVPMFVSVDDAVIVNTTTGEYQGRPGKGQ
jgi:elongation factor P